MPRKNKFTVSSSWATEVDTKQDRLLSIYNAPETVQHLKQTGLITMLGNMATMFITKPISVRDQSRVSGNPGVVNLAFYNEALITTIPLLTTAAIQLYGEKSPEAEIFEASIKKTSMWFIPRTAIVIEGLNP